MKLIDIVMWTTSFGLALIGILFGIIASWQSSRANKKIENLIFSSWATEESRRIFFDNVKAVSSNNAQSIKLLEHSNEITYREYALHSSHGRFINLPKEVVQIIVNTDFKDLATEYIAIKKNLDRVFIETIGGDFSILSSNDFITNEMKDKLKDYHNNVIRQSRIIITRYNQILSSSEAQH